MSIIGPLNFVLPEDVARSLGAAAQARRLADNLSRKSLAALSGVPAPTIRNFEGSGKISLLGLLQLADALGCLDNFADLFPARPTASIDQLIAPPRRRGTR